MGGAKEPVRHARPFSVSIPVKATPLGCALCLSIAPRLTVAWPRQRGERQISCRVTLGLITIVLMDSSAYELHGSAVTSAESGSTILGIAWRGDIEAGRL